MKLNAQNPFTNLKCTLAWSSNSSGSGSVIVNTAFGASNYGAYTLPFDASNIAIIVEATITPTSSVVIFSLKNGNQLIAPISPSSPNPTYTQMSSQTVQFFATWVIPKTLLANNQGINVKAESVIGANSTFTGCNFSGIVSNTISPLVLTGPTYTGNPCTTGANYIIFEASGAGGRGTYNCSYTFNGVQYATCMDCFMGNTKGMGTYTITVTSAGLTETKTFTIGPADCSALTVTSAVLSPAKCTSANGSAAITATGGTGSYTYLWSNGATTATVTNLLGNTPHTCQVTSGTGTQNITVIVPKTNTPIMATIKSKAGTKHNNKIEVWINGTPITGPNYTFLWSTGATTPSIDLPLKMAQPRRGAILSFDQSAAGVPVTTPTPVNTPSPTTTYTVTVTDAFGCTGIATYVY
jgi:SprB repeat